MNRPLALLAAIVCVQRIAFSQPMGDVARDRTVEQLVAQLQEVRLTTDGHFKQRPAWSPDGSRLLFARHRQDRIWLYSLDRDGGDERRLTERDEPEYDGVWSPDGRAIVFTLISFSGTQGDLDVFRIDADSSGLAPLAKTAAKLSHEEWPAWSPDGRWLAFTSTQPGNQEIFVAKPDGGDPRQVTQHAGIDAHPAWSPDGRRLAFSTDRWGGMEIALMNSDGSDVRRLTTSPRLDDYPAWSPDGRSLVFVSNRDGDFEIYLIRPDGSEQVNLSRSPGVDSFPTWTPDGRGITYVSERSGGFDIYTVHFGE